MLLINLECKMKKVKIQKGEVRTGIRDIEIWLLFEEDNITQIPQINKSVFEK